MKVIQPIMPTDYEMTMKYLSGIIWAFSKSVENTGFFECCGMRDRGISFLEIVCGLIPHLGFKSLTLRQESL
jgi:hypothetical protein